MRVIDPYEQHARRLAPVAKPVDVLARELEERHTGDPVTEIVDGYLATITPEAQKRLAREALAELIRLARQTRQAVVYRAPRQRTPEEREERRWFAKLRREQAAERDRLLREEPEEYRARYTLGGAIERFRQEVRGELMRDLGATFALDDGRVIQWGQATVAEHEQAAQEALIRADHDLTTLARHEEAAETLRRSNVRCLAEVRAAA